MVHGASTEEKALGNSTNISEPAASEPTDTPSHGFWHRLKRQNVDLDSIATQPSVFDNPDGLEAYRPPASYENSHRFDPAARWTWREEKVRTLIPHEPPIG